MKENKGMNYATMQNSTRFGDTMAVLKTIQTAQCPTAKTPRKTIYQAFEDQGVPGKYAATALRLSGVRVPNMSGFYRVDKMIEGMEKKFGGTGVSKMNSIKAKTKAKTKVKTKVKRVKIQKAAKPEVIKLQGMDSSAHSPTEEITDISYARIERIESLGTPGFHPTADDIADELSLMGTYL